MKYGVVGLGNLGGKIARNLLRAGFELQVHDLDRNAAGQLETDGAVWCDTPAETATGVDGLLTCLTAPKVSHRVMLGENGALAAMSPGSVWIETSTTDVDEIQRIAARAAERGVGTLEAPVTGGVHRAERGQITVLVGGSEQDLARHRPALEAFGDPIIHLGDIGAASTLKVITNMLAFVNLIAAGEGLMLAKRAGLDLAAAYRAIQASSGNSIEFETVAPVILNGSFDTSFTLELACKDLGLMMELGRSHGVPLKFTGLMDQMFLEAKARYGGNAWTPHVVKMMEDVTGVTLRASGFPDKMMDAGDVQTYCAGQRT